MATTSKSLMARKWSGSFDFSAFPELSTHCVVLESETVTNQLGPERTDADGHRWHSADYVRQWVSEREGDPIRDSRQEREFSMIVEAIRPLAPTQPGSPRAGNPAGDVPLHFLDLGCGWGSLSAHLLEQFPGSRVVALDHSVPMLELCRDRLAGYAGRAQIVLRDLESPQWFSGLHTPFDSVVSMRTLHHLTRPRHLALYGEIVKCLRTGGRFVNLDRATPHGRARLADRVSKVPAVAALLYKVVPRWWRGASVSQHREALERAGFSCRIRRLDRGWLTACTSGPDARVEL